MGEARTGGEAALSGVTAELDAALRHAAAQAPGSAAFAELRDAVRRSPRVRELLGEITPGVRSGEVSAVDGSARILEAFSADLAERDRD